jgi:hypothetical protein
MEPVVMDSTLSPAGAAVIAGTCPARAHHTAHTHTHTHTHTNKQTNRHKHKHKHTRARALSLPPALHPPLLPLSETRPFRKPLTEIRDAHSMPPLLLPGLGRSLARRPRIHSLGIAGARIRSLLCPSLYRYRVPNLPAALPSPRWAAPVRGSGERAVISRDHVVHP